jgi:DNA-binding transcriptional MerR regulator
MEYYKIGKLAKLANTTIVTIRYYEKLGLLGKIKRSSGGFRLYSETLISVFYFIKNAKAVGFNLDEIKTLLTLQKNKAPSQRVKKKTQQKVQAIDEKIKTLTTMRDALSTWENACDGKVSIDQCPILVNLYKKPNSDKI